MEFLKSVKTPSNFKQSFGEVRIRVQTDVTKENSDRIISLLELLNKKISIDHLNIIEENPVKKATNIQKKIILIQMSESEINSLNKKTSIDFAKKESINEDTRPIEEIGEDKKNTELKIKKPNPEKKKNSFIKENVSENESSVIENESTASEYEDNAQLLDRYKKYVDDDKIFKVPLVDFYSLNNQKKFSDDIKKKLMQYLDGIDSGDQTSCDLVDKNAGFSPLIHQELIKHYLNSYSPYRGVLLYHGLGSGKTCTSIGVIEAMKSTKPKIYIMTTAALQNNYKSQLKFCGSSLFNEDENWKYINYPTEQADKKKFIKNVQSITKLPMEYLNSKNGVFMIEKESSDNDDNEFMTIERVEELRQQIDKMIESRFEFISYNGITMKKWVKKYKTKKEINPFDNSVVVIDEGHNFVSRIVNKLNKKEHSISTELYTHLTTAENCRIVILSGTPLINYPNELGVMFNLIGGCNMVIEFKCEHKTKRFMETSSKIREVLGDLNTIDHIEYNKKTNLIQIMKNPYGFTTSDSKQVIFDTNQNLTISELNNKIKSRLIEEGYTLSDTESKDLHMSSKKILELHENMYAGIKVYNKFPDTEDAFNDIFVNKKTNGLKNYDYFRNKITGMVSYVGDKKELMPTMIKSDTEDNIFIERIPMNEYVMSRYKDARALESSIDRNSSKKGKTDEQTSSYKIFSRAACNFVFPPGFDKPIPSKSLLTKMEEDDLEILSDNEMLDMNDGKYDTDDIKAKSSPNKSSKDRRERYRREISALLSAMEKNASKYLESEIPKEIKNLDNLKLLPDDDIIEDTANSLKTYSPKFYKMLQNILDSKNEGLHLLYSNFRTLEGIGIFKIVMEYYGYSELKLKSVSTGNQIIYNIEVENAFYNNSNFNTTDSLKGRKFYALYTGKENAEEKEMIRNIFNGAFDKIPISLKEDIVDKLFDGDQEALTNNLGDVIKLLMITSSGAEGIDLKNVRFVHITEPYWHPVRISQVIGRARRICSHSNLEPHLQTVKVFLYLIVYSDEFKNTKITKKGDSSAKDELYAQLKIQDKDKASKNSFSTTDEKLFAIMEKKKKLMGEFLDAIKTASVDCFFNYEDKEKCLSFPIQSTPYQKIYGVDYNLDPKRNIQMKSNKSISQKKNKKNSALIDEDNNFTMDSVKDSALTLRQITLHKGDGTIRKFAVDKSMNPYVVYDYNAAINNKYIRVGIVKRDKNRQVLIED